MSCHVQGENVRVEIAGVVPSRLKGVEVEGGGAKPLTRILFEGQMRIDYA